MRSASMHSPMLLGVVLQLVSAASVINSNLPGNWTYRGCYNEGSGTRALVGGSYASNTAMNQTSCINFCNSGNYIYAGIEYASECYCGSNFKGGSSKVDSMDCNMGCSGNSTEQCGAGNRLTVFWSGQKEPDPPITNPGIARSPSGWGSLGCYSDNVNGRTLPFGVDTKGGAGNLTIANCVAACSATTGYTYAGAEYGGECFCGSSIGSGGAKVSSGCDMLCNGNSSEFCGGPNRLNVYRLGAPIGPETTTVSSWTSATTSTPVTDPDTPATTTSNVATTSEKADTTTSSTVSASQNRESETSDQSTDEASLAPSTTPLSSGVSSSVVSTTEGTTSADPTSVTSSSTTSSTSGLPTGWSYKGCWIDNKIGRILANQQPDDADTTIESCVAACRKSGFSVAGIEYSTQCFCGNAIIQAGEEGDEADCNMPCGGDADQKCGGPNRMSIYASGTLKTIGIPKPQNETLPGNYKYAGCYTEGQGTRALPWFIFDNKNNTADRCCTQCAKFGYRVCGLEYGEECYCGDESDLAAVDSIKKPDSECATPCSGDPSAICGGGNRLTTYIWDNQDDPLYVWNYAEDDAAGEYRNLIGGLVIPLITVPGINGKITFVEKFGTSQSGNSSGAYELDPSQVDNFDLAWREMGGLKTDVFCAAGIILPDRAGRSLNIGGWSGISTFGVRLYWPDGAPGVESKNSWEENAQEIKLQAGRWYPSAMTMVNGSILVIGGQDGSNGAPVPSLELLPKSGGVIDLEWLRRTDPNNLYPFLAVLPSGGIFVSYFNEARILDPVTFDTIKELPLIPGSVIGGDSGRTYPLEGTSMLLPQYAPYSDPLEVLICGGSVAGPGFALDNCVTIAPDADEPEWVIERMPSKRVMSCITALPDGTYLINNGAHQGVAGFGLATKPNLNAVLYDPTRPIGQRMTVLANTTVARMYHSESVLMDDGRVLVTGSDPEDNVHPQEFRVEVFVPPYLTNGKARPTYTISNRDWEYGGTYSINVNSGGNVRVSLLAAVASTHGNSMGQRTLFPAVSCSGSSCSITAPPRAEIAPMGWYQLFVLDGDTPSEAQWVRIGGDPAELGNWPPFDDFSKPGVGSIYDDF